MSMIRMSESELMQLANNVKRQQQNTDDVNTACRTAVGQADAGWHSAAFDSFKERYNRDKTILNNLATALRDWNQQLAQVHAPTAHTVNRPFQ